MNTHALGALVLLTSSRRPPDDAPLPDKVRWLEELTRTADAALVDAPARAALTDLRAALGAVVQWGRGARTPQSLVELELVFRALVVRGCAGLYEGIARELRALDADGVDPGARTVAADAFADAARAIAEGREVNDVHVRAMHELARTLESAAGRGPPAAR